MESRFNKNYQIYRKYLNQIILTYQKRKDIRLFLETLLTLGTIIFFGLFAVKPTFVTVAELYKGKLAKEQTLNTLNIKIENLIAAEKLYRQYENEIAILQESIPSRPMAETVVRQIEGLANRENVQLLSFNLDGIIIKGPKTTKNVDEALPEDTSSGTDIVGFSLSVSGNYNQLDSFLRNMENMRRPVSFQEVNFQKLSTKTEASTNLLLNINGYIPYLPLNE